MTGLKQYGRFFEIHCKLANVRYRGPNQARHTYASQLLTKGAPKEWIAGQMGHTTTKMIDDHYGKWIVDDAPTRGASSMIFLASRTQ